MNFLLFPFALLFLQFPFSTMYDPINWYQSQRSTVDLWFGPVDPTLPAPWKSVTDDSTGMVFYWNPETNVSQYEHPTPHPRPDHYQSPFEYKPSFLSSDLTYRPPDYPASYMPELSVTPSYTSPIFLPHPAPPSFVYSDSMDVPQIPHSYAPNPNFYHPQIHSPASYQQNLWVFDSENRLRFNDPYQVSPYELDLCYNSIVHTAPSTAAPTAPNAAPASSAASSEGLLVSSFSFQTASGATASSSAGFLSLTKESTPAPSSQAQPSATVPESGVGTSAPARLLSFLRFPPIRFSKSENSLRFETLSDDEREENELNLTSPEVVTKYKSAAGLVNKALQLVISGCQPKVKIMDLCEKKDSYIREQTGTMSKIGKKTIERGVASPTCISVHNTVRHLSPLASDESVLEEGDIPKIDLGFHIDGFIAIVAHTHVLQAGPVTGKVADVIAAANPAAEVALRLVRLGKKHKDVTEAMQKVAVILGSPPNVTMSRLGSLSSTFTYTILPYHEPSLVPNSTNSNNSLPNLNGYHDFAKGVTSMGFSLTHSKANLQLIRLCKLSFLYTTKTGPEIFNSLHDCSGNWRVLFCWLPYDVLFNDSSEWFCQYPVSKLGKGLLIAADLFDEKSKRWHEVYRGTLFDFIYHPPVWDPGYALTKTTELMLCFKCQKNHFNEHPQFLDLQLHSIDYVVYFTCLQPQMFATRVGIIQHKSRLLYFTAVQSQCMRYCFCSNLSTDYVVCMTEMQDFFHASGLYIYDHEPYHISIVGVCPFAATYVILPIQRLVSLALIIGPLVILTAFGKHFNGEEFVAWCNATEMASTDFGLNVSAMISFVYLDGLLGHDQGSIGLQVWGNNGSHGLVGKIQILGTASTIEEPELIFMEPIKQDQTSKNFRDALVRCFLLCKTITHDDLHISFVLSHNEEVMPLFPTCVLSPNMDFMSMILWCGMKSLVIHDAQNFFTVNSHLAHAQMLKVLIGIKLLYENWQEKSEATLGNARVTSMVFPLNAWRILTLPHEKIIVRTASCDWVMKLCIRDDFVGVPLSRHWKYAVLGSSSWGEEYANDCQKPLVVQSSCLGASSSLQSLFHHPHTTSSFFIPTVDKFQKLTIDFELSSSKMHAELLTNSAIVDQGSTETEWMRKCYLFHFFTSTFQHRKSVIWFFTDDILFTAWIRPIWLTVYQLKTITYDLLPYLKNYEVVQLKTVSNGSSKLSSDVSGFHKSSTEFLNWEEISFLLPVESLLLTLLVTKRLRQSLLLPDVVQSGALSLQSPIVSENYLDKHCSSFGVPYYNWPSLTHNGVLVILVNLQQSIAELFFPVSWGPFFLFPIPTCLVHTDTILPPWKFLDPPYSS